ncbi:NAD(P)-dependent oxidoreductase [Nocardia nova]|uniref:NAD(P)-dependent oxidoreductase n=1 Tax=Nocardia nova TaxID=37330 RepID=UPI002351CED7|nr:NAD(P)-dependent oxidoreductase [Nocardia nova]
MSVRPLIPRAHDGGRPSGDCLPFIHVVQQQFSPADGSDHHERRHGDPRLGNPGRSRIAPGAGQWNRRRAAPVHRGTETREAAVHIAVLGMGQMGRALARRLLRGGHRVTVWNRTKGRVGQLESAGAVEAATVAEAVSGADAVITMLADDVAVTSVAFGELQSALAADTPYLDCSTVSPALGAALADAFGARFLSVPIVGAPAAVEAGKAVLLAGGEAALIDRLAPLLGDLSDRIRRYDSAAHALTAKVTTNFLLLSGVAALAEAFAVGRSGGLGDEQLRELLAEAPVVAPALANRFDAVLTASPQGWWTTVLGAKDAGLALDIAAAAEVELPVAETVRGRYERAAHRNPDADISAVAALYRGRTGPSS